MSASANPYHSGQAASFMKTLKVEEVYLASYETFADAASRWRASLKLPKPDI
jgi:putative transposase